MKLIEGFDSNYRFILVAARRARQIQAGAPALVKTSSRKPARIAQDEINAGLIKHVVLARELKPLDPPVHVFDGGKHEA